MNTTSNKIVFFGNERLATGVSTTAPTLQALIAAGYHVMAVVNHHTPGQSRNGRDLEVAEIAKQHNIPLLLPDNLNDISGELDSYKAIAGVLVAFGQMVPESVINLFSRGIINIHPSSLPLHRGPTPLESIILSGEKRTAVSVMQLVKQMDAGPIYAQQNVELSGSESKQELADRLLSVGGELLIKNLSAILNGSLTAKPQTGEPTYDSLITKEDGLLDWNQPATELECQIRAFAGWPKSRTTLAGKDVVVTKAHVVDAQGKPGTVTVHDKQIIVTTSEGGLSLDILKPAGKGEMPASAFLAGYKSLL